MGQLNTGQKNYVPMPSHDVNPDGHRGGLRNETVFT